MRSLCILFLVISPLMGRSQDVTVTLKSQPEWPPGKPVLVVVDINKNNVEGFARFFQDLPQGFKVECVDNAGADFYWENNQVNLVWLELPDQQVISVKYLVQADALLSGSFKLGGRFDYIINNNERKSSETIPLQVRLDKSATVDESYAVITDVLEEKADTSDKNIPVLKEETVKPVEIKINFRIQVALASERLTDTELAERLGCELNGKITILKTGSMFKYQAGSFSKYGQAQVYLAELKDCGVDDAFIVAYQGAEQISVNLARTLTE